MSSFVWFFSFKFEKIIVCLVFFNLFPSFLILFDYYCLKTGEFFLDSLERFLFLVGLVGSSEKKQKLFLLFDFAPFFLPFCAILRFFALLAFCVERQFSLAPSSLVTLTMYRHRVDDVRIVGQKILGD